MRVSDMSAGVVSARRVLCEATASRQRSATFIVSTVCLRNKLEASNKNISVYVETMRLMDSFCF